MFWLLGVLGLSRRDPLNPRTDHGYDYNYNYIKSKTDIRFKRIYSKIRYVCYIKTKLIQSDLRSEDWKKRACQSQHKKRQKETKRGYERSHAGGIIFHRGREQSSRRRGIKKVVLI